MCERPSSTTVQSSPIRSSAACTREISESQSSTTSLDGRRPIVTRSPVGDEVDDHLQVVRVAVDEERRAAALGRDALLEVLRGGDVGVER